MATYRLWPATNGPGTATNITGNFITGVCWQVTTSSMWFEGYWTWVATIAQSTAPVKCALWSLTGAGVGTLVPGSVVTSGTLNAGQWNYIPLDNPIPISIGDSFVAAIGVNGNFPSTSNYWSAGPVVNGPLYAFGKAISLGGTSYLSGGSAEPYNTTQGCFTTAGSDPSVTMPNVQSSTDNFWVDVQVSDIGPPTYPGPYRLWPNRAAADAFTVLDDNKAYVTGTEFILSRYCQIDKVWFYSNPGAPNLPAAIDVWQVNVGITGTNLYHNGSPAWLSASGGTAVAGGGWIQAAVSGLKLVAGTYKVSVYDQNGLTGSSGCKRLSYWGVDTGDSFNAQAAIGINGVAWGPLSAPPTASATTAYNFSNNNLTEPGQSVFSVGDGTSSMTTGDMYPNQYVDGLFQNYWVDIEVTPASTGHGGSFLPFLLA